MFSIENKTKQTRKSLDWSSFGGVELVKLLNEMNEVYRQFFSHTKHENLYKRKPQVANYGQVGWMNEIVLLLNGQIAHNIGL